MKHPLSLTAFAVGLLSLGAATLVATGLTSCSQVSAASSHYRVTLPVAPSEDGLTAYLVDFDTGDKIDSTLVVGSTARFDNTCSELPRMARVILDGRRRALFVLEGGGEIVVDTASRIATGTPLNDRFVACVAFTDSIESAYDAVPDDSLADTRRASLLDSYTAGLDKIIAENSDNPIGYYFFLQSAYEWDAVTLAQRLEQMPAMAGYKRIASLQQSMSAAATTSPGYQYKDFAVQYGDSTYRLSDYVGKDGRYTLVDFWASWCGPCIKETATVRQLYDRFGPAGEDRLNVVGVAVWDDPENTIRAITTHQLPWSQIINAGTIPTDLYGIPGIPCIILIDPQGTIVCRDLQGPSLLEAVTTALTPTPAPDPE